MHPPRRKRTTEPQGFADRMVDWLLTHCPFCTLTVLTLVVIGPTLGPVPQPLFVGAAVIIADLIWGVIHRVTHDRIAQPRRRQKQHREMTPAD